MTRHSDTGSYQCATGSCQYTTGNHQCTTGSRLCTTGSCQCTTGSCQSTTGSCRQVSMTGAHLVHVNNLRDGDVDDRFTDARHVCVLVNVKHLLRFRDVTHGREELPTHGHSQAPTTRHTQSSTDYTHTSHAVKHRLYTRHTLSRTDYTSHGWFTVKHRLQTRTWTDGRGWTLTTLLVSISL